MLDNTRIKIIKLKTHCGIRINSHPVWRVKFPSVTYLVLDCFVRGRHGSSLRLIQGEFEKEYLPYCAEHK